MSNDDMTDMTYFGTMPDAEKALYVQIAQLGEELTGAREALAGLWDTDTALRQEIASLGEQVRTQARRHVEDTSALQRSHEERIERITRVLHEAGEEHEWCSTYDSILADAGLPGRQRNYDVTVSVTITLSLTLSVSAVGYDAAGEAVDEAMVRAALELPSHLPDSDVTWDVGEVEAADD